jgi:hypothetical protein
VAGADHDDIVVRHGRSLSRTTLAPSTRASPRARPARSLPAAIAGRRTQKTWRRRGRRRQVRREPGRAPQGLGRDQNSRRASIMKLWLW